MAKTIRKTVAKKKSATRKPTRRKATASRGLQLKSGAMSITVDDVSKSLAWYCDVLGFSVKQRWEREGTLVGGELVAGGVTVYVGQDDWKKGRDRVKGQGVRLYWYAGTSKEVDRIAAAIESRGGALATEPKDEWGARSFNLEDPNGFLITVSS